MVIRKEFNNSRTGKADSIIDDNDELGYVSSAVSPFETEKGEPSIDAPDEKTLDGLLRVIDEQIKLFHTIDGVKMFDKALSLEQRFEMCDKYVALLFSHRKKIINAIDDIRSKQNG